MTSAPSPRPVSALRARMIEDMMVRGFTEETRNDYATPLNVPGQTLRVSIERFLAAGVLRVSRTPVPWD